MMRAIAFSVSGALAAAAALTPAVAQTRVEKTFEKWVVTCVEKGGVKSCAITQSFANPRNKAVVFSWSVIKDAEGVKAVIRTPTNIKLAEGVQVKTSADKPIRISYKTCGPRYCFAEMNFGDDWVKYFQASQTVPVTISPMQGATADVTVDLKGFAAAYTYFQEQTAG